MGRIDYVVVQLVKELRTTDASVIYVGVQHTQYACTRCKAHATAGKTYRMTLVRPLERQFGQEKPVKVNIWT